MGRMMGLGFFVCAMWVGLELYTEGPSRAFGGIFGDGTVVEDSGAPVQRAQKSADKVRDAYAEQEARIDRAFAD